MFRGTDLDEGLTAPHASGQDLFSCVSVWQAHEITGKAQCVVLVWATHSSWCSGSSWKV